MSCISIHQLEILRTFAKYIPGRRHSLRRASGCTAHHENYGLKDSDEIVDTIDTFAVAVVVVVAIYYLIIIRLYFICFLCCCSFHVVLEIRWVCVCFGCTQINKMELIQTLAVLLKLRALHSRWLKSTSLQQFSIEEKSV